MKKICTTIEQSKELIELGIDRYTSDMCYLRENGKPKAKRMAELYILRPQVVPAWSLSALLELLPSATLDISNDHHYRMHCCKQFTDWHGTAVDAAVAMIKRLKEQNE